MNATTRRAIATGTVLAAGLAVPLGWLVPHLVGTDPNAGPTAAALDEGWLTALGGGIGAGIGAALTAWLLRREPFPARLVHAMAAGYIGAALVVIPFLLVVEIGSGDGIGFTLFAVFAGALASVWLLAPPLVSGAVLGALTAEATQSLRARRAGAR